MKLQIDPTKLEPFSLATIWRQLDGDDDTAEGSTHICYKGHPIGDPVAGQTSEWLRLVVWLNANHDTLRTAMAPQSSLHYPPGVRGVSA